MMSEENMLVINDKLSIPLSELAFRFSTSGGPGGQHANRSATRATVLFDVAHSESLTDTMREQIMSRLASRIDAEGVLAVTSQESRSQHQNRELALTRLQELLAAALRERKKRRKTKPSAAARERRLAAKRRRSEIKRERGRKWPE